MGKLDINTPVFDEKISNTEDFQRFKKRIVEWKETATMYKAEAEKLRAQMATDNKASAELDEIDKIISWYDGLLNL